jgi:hypothetical protein
MIASIIPSQFFGDKISLNKIIPKSVDIITIATLFTVKIPELSNKSLLRAFTKKNIEK